jgi:hypothetical protein
MPPLALFQSGDFGPRFFVPPLHNELRRAACQRRPTRISTFSLVSTLNPHSKGFKPMDERSATGLS